MKIFLTLLGAVIGGFVGQVPGVFIGSGLGFIIGFGLSAKRSETDFNAGPATPVSSSRKLTAEPPRLSPDRYNTSYGRAPSNVQMRWIEPGEGVTVQGVSLAGGLIYVSDGVPDTLEPSLLNRKLPVSSGSGGSVPLPYFPTYDTVTPDQRGEYLDWLAKGRRDEDPSQRQFGYIFLFFYGLERRVLVDGDMSAKIGGEIAELMELYSSFGKSKSLPTYFSQLLHFWAFHQGREVYAQLWPWILDLKHSVLDEEELELVLSSLATSGQNAPARVAREIAFHSDGAVRSSVATRSPAEFRALFDERFGNEFPGGVPLALLKRNAVSTYLPASGVLRYVPEREKSRFVARVNAVAVSAADRKKLVALWNDCCTCLSGYVRAKAKADGKDIDLATFLATPPELRERQLGALSARLDDLLNTAAKDENLLFTQACNLSTFFRLPARERYTLSQSKQVAEGLELLGWLMEPDPRIHGAALGATQEVVIFKGAATSTAPGFLGRCALIQMSVMLAGADGTFDLRESESISMLIDGSDAPEHEKHRLRAWAMLLGRDINNAPTTIAKVAKAVHAPNRQAIAQLLCRIVTADGLFTKAEERILDRIFKNLTLAPEIIALLKKELDGFDEVRVATAEPTEVGERIPQPKPGDKTARFALDNKRLNALKAETAEVIQILSVAMADAEHEPKNNAGVPTKHEKAISGVPAADTAPEWMTGLEARYVPFAVRLVERDTWTRTEFIALATEFHLMPTAAVDGINGWSDESLGDFLVSGDDPVEVNRSLIP